MMTSLFVVLASIFIRIIIPALLMLGLIFLLRRLDAGWQAQALYQQKLQAANSQLRTWELQDCPVENLASRPALHSVEPCWQVFRQSNGYLHEECLRCKVFRASPILLPN